MTAPSAGRRGRRWRRLHASVKARRDPCCLCGKSIDYTLAYPHPMSFSVHHVKARHTHPHLAEDPGNLLAAHLLCNQQRGEREPLEVGPTSEDW